MLDKYYFEQLSGTGQLTKERRNDERLGNALKIPRSAIKHFYYNELIMGR